MKSKVFTGLILSIVFLSLSLIPFCAYATDSNVENLDVVSKKGSIYLDEWSHSQYKGAFTDADGKVFKGIGMFSDIYALGKEGIAFVELKIPENSTSFTTYIAIEKNWCGTEAYGTSKYTIYVDGTVAFTKTLTATISAELVDIPLPSGAEILRLEVEQNWKNKSGNHACIWAEPTFIAATNEGREQTAIAFEGHAYKMFDIGMNWHEAKKYCEDLGGHLATVTSAEEQQFIEKLIANGSQNHYWLGAYEENTWEWVTDEPFVYTNWASGQPDNNLGNEHYLQIFRVENKYRRTNKANKWNDINENCTIKNEEDFFLTALTGFICEWGTIWTSAAKWATPELQAAADAGLIPDTLAGEDFTKPITRGEFAAVAVQLYETWMGKSAPIPTNCPFADIVGDINRISILKAYGLSVTIGISPAIFDSSTLITREQLATMLCRVYKTKEWLNWTLSTDDNFTLNYSGVVKFDDDADISDYAKPSVYFMVKHEVVSGMGNSLFAPKNSTPAQEAVGYATATREQAVLMSLRSFENLV